jgi:hypothetical protein
MKANKYIIRIYKYKIYISINKYNLGSLGGEVRLLRVVKRWSEVIGPRSYPIVREDSAPDLKNEAVAGRGTRKKPGVGSYRQPREKTFSNTRLLKRRTSEITRLLARKIQ